MTPRPNSSDSKPFYRRSAIDNTNLDKFKYLHKNVLNKESSSITSSSEVVDALKQLAEYLIWEDKHNEDAIFEYFCEENIMDYMTGVLCRSTSRAVRIQLVQTISMLIHNITNKRTLYYLLSNNYINGLITVPEMYSGGDVSSWTISLLKTLSSILNKSTIKFFFLQKNQVFPLLDRSLIFLNNHDSMKRAHVMTIILNIFKVKDDDVVDYIIHKSKILLQLVLYLKYCWYRLNKYINKYYKFDENILIECDDILCFIEELMDLEIVSINQKLVYYIFNICFIPLIKKVLKRSSVNPSLLRSLNMPKRVDLEYLNNVYYKLSSSVGLAHLYITNKTNLYNNFSDPSTTNDQLLTEPLLNEHLEREQFLQNTEVEFENKREKLLKSQRDEPTGVVDNDNKEDNKNDKEDNENTSSKNDNKNDDEDDKDRQEQDNEDDLTDSMKVEMDDEEHGHELVNNVLYYIIVNVLINCRRKELLRPLLLLFFSPFMSRKLLVQLVGSSRNSSLVTTPTRTPTSNKNTNSLDDFMVRDEPTGVVDNDNDKTPSVNLASQVDKQFTSRDTLKSEVEVDLVDNDNQVHNNSSNKEDNNNTNQVDKGKEDKEAKEYKEQKDLDNYSVENEELFTSNTKTFVINQDNINAYNSLLEFSEYFDSVTDYNYTNKSDYRTHMNSNSNDCKSSTTSNTGNNTNNTSNNNSNNNAEEVPEKLLLDDDCVVNVIMGVFIYDGLASLKVKDNKLLMLLKLLLHFQLQLVKVNHYELSDVSYDNTPTSVNSNVLDYSPVNQSTPSNTTGNTNSNTSDNNNTSSNMSNNNSTTTSKNDMMKELLVVKALLCNNNIYLQIFNAICSNVTNYKLNVILVKLYNSLLNGYVTQLSGSNRELEQNYFVNQSTTSNTASNRDSNSSSTNKTSTTNSNNTSNNTTDNTISNTTDSNRNTSEWDKKQMMVEQQLRDELRFHLDIIYNIIRLYVLNSIESTTLFYLSVFYNEWIKYVKLNYTNIHNLIHYNDILPLPNDDEDDFENVKYDDRENPLNRHISEQMDRNSKELDKKSSKILKEKQKEKLVKRLFSRGNKSLKSTNSTISNSSNVGQEEYKHSPINIFKRYIQIILLFKELYNIINKDNSKSLNDKVNLKTIEDASLYLYEACPLFYNHLDLLYLGNKQVKLGNLIKLNNVDGVRYFKCIIRNNNDQRERLYLVNDIFFILAKVKVRKENRLGRNEVRKEVKEYREEQEDISGRLQNLLLGHPLEASNYEPVTKEDFLVRDEPTGIIDDSGNNKEDNEAKQYKEHKDLEKVEKDTLKENTAENNENKNDNEENKKDKEIKSKEQQDNDLNLEITCVHFLWNCLLKKIDKANFKFNILISWHPNFKSLTPSHYYSNSNNKWNDPINPIVSEFEIIFSSLQDLNAVLKLHNNNKKNLSSTCLLSLQDYLYN